MSVPHSLVLGCHPLAVPSSRLTRATAVGSSAICVLKTPRFTYHLQPGPLSSMLQTPIAICVFDSSPGGGRGGSHVSTAPQNLIQSQACDLSTQIWSPSTVHISDWALSPSSWACQNLKVVITSPFSTSKVLSNLSPLTLSPPSPLHDYSSLLPELSPTYSYLSNPFFNCQKNLRV